MYVLGRKPGTWLQDVLCIQKETDQPLVYPQEATYAQLGHNPS